MTVLFPFLDLPVSPVLVLSSVIKEFFLRIDSLVFSDFLHEVRELSILEKDRVQFL